MPKALGLDFGTTNTVLSQIQPDRRARPISCPIDGAPVEALRSALCFWQTSARDGRQLRVEAGPYAIHQFIDHPGECRFIQSFKTFGASPHFQGTYVYGKRYKFEDLLELLFARIRHYESAQLNELPPRLVVGRPVEFAGAQPDGSSSLSYIVRLPSPIQTAKNKISTRSTDHEADRPQVRRHVATLYPRPEDSGAECGGTTRHLIPSCS